MGKLVVSLDGVVIKEVQITKDKTTARPAPAWRHRPSTTSPSAASTRFCRRLGQDVFIEDLERQNGTYINGKAVKKQLLAHNDTVEVGKYKIKFMVDDGADYEKTR